MAKYDYVLFDLDGTLSNTSKGVFNATDYMISKLRLRPLTEEEKRSILGPPLYQSFHKFFGLEKDDLENAVELYREYYHEKGCYENTMYDGIVELLFKLKKSGIKLMVATSKPNNITPKVLKSFGIYDLFDYIAAPDPKSESDDKSALISTALDAVNCSDKSKALMVGDRLYDIAAANKVGIDSLGVTFGFGSRDELSSYNATYIANNADEIEYVVTGGKI